MEFDFKSIRPSGEIKRFRNGVIHNVCLWTRLVVIDPLCLDRACVGGVCPDGGFGVSREGRGGVGLGWAVSACDLRVTELGVGVGRRAEGYTTSDDTRQK
jgi:hypothetical protein